ncbi:asparagine synthase (glutamine-hydrolyzing) [Candidatus Stoquefichus massiliensis]|uniref:asparagine synthase (glutamine-hydrolyzing) n=1 Tax=Candidatus Stoquefichus massiliensis TaxID=1470350 RepID=UPI000485BBB6|nr:asparagine synthase (glutamine-hydrolyzing) [Candidatus Stoquefichus massiliensis]
MCGIVGFAPVSENAPDMLKKMMDRIAHRGPDGEGQYVDDYVALGHRRLSIIDLAGGTQPMKTNHLVVVFNGEIYNYLELKKDLEAKGHHFQTHSDTEVLLHGYEEYHYDIVNYLRGMFAFALYDTTTHELFCARDHFGIKPFYYYYDQKHFLFASEIKGFLDHPDFKKELNKDVLDIYLKMNFVAGEETFFKNVKQLLPGHYVVYKDQNIDIKRYYSIQFKDQYKSDQEMIEMIDQIMKDSVKHHLIADVEVGSFLSSGIDSSYLVSLARPQHTYTVGYNDERYNEIGYAKDLTQQLGIENKSKIISKEEYLNILPQIMYHLDEPTADPAAVALYFVSELASKDVKVVLSGEGADEFFGGYNTYRGDIDSGIYGKIPFAIRHFISRICKHLPTIKGIPFLIRNGERIEDYYVGVNPVFSQNDCKHLLRDTTHLHSHQDIVAPLFKNLKKATNIQKRQNVDLQTWFIKDILQKGDKMTMAHSIESRVPFTDREVFDVASCLKDNQKVTKENTKVLLREAARKVIPNEAYKKKKLGFPVPLREWMREEDLYQKVYEGLQTPIIKELFDDQKLISMLEDHKNQKHDYYKKIWTVYCFSLWHQVFFSEEYKKQA